MAVELTREHVTSAVPVAVVAILAILTVPHAEEPATVAPEVASSVPADRVRIFAEEPLLI